MWVSWILMMMMMMMMVGNSGNNIHHTTMVLALSSPSSSSSSSSPSSQASISSTSPLVGPLDRRRLFQSVASSVVTSGLAVSAVPPLAHAGGLLQFPITDAVPLKNEYHLLRAGWSELEHDGIYSTNPLFLTNRENQMHIPTGPMVVKKAVDQLRQQSDTPTVIYHSLAANGMDTGDLIARELKLGRDRLLPEFTYLDQRGIGLWDSSDVSIAPPMKHCMISLLDCGNSFPCRNRGRRERPFLLFSPMALDRPC
jgi:hypothetical protein